MKTKTFVGLKSFATFAVLNVLQWLVLLAKIAGCLNRKSYNQGSTTPSLRVNASTVAIVTLSRGKARNPFYFFANKTA